MKTSRRKTGSVSFLIVLIFIPFFFRGASAETISLDQYESRIREAIDYCESDEYNRPLDIRSELQRLFPHGLVVQKKDKEIFPIDTKEIISRLRVSSVEDKDLKNITSHLNVLLQHISSTKDNKATNLDWKESRRNLEEIYLSREFKNMYVPKVPFWVKYLERFSNLIRNWIYNNIEKIDHIPSSLGTILLIIVYGLIIILGGIIFFLISKYFGWFGWQRRDKKVYSREKEIPSRPDWGLWRKGALEKASEGKFREAVRLLFISTLMEGHIKGWWVYEPEATNKEHLARIKGSAKRLKAMRTMVSLYEKAWYGMRETGKEEFQNFEKIAKLIENTS